MKSGYMRGFAAVLLATTLSVSSVSALDLLGLATVNEAAPGSVVDAQIGGGSAVSADVLPGGSSSAAKATVSTGNGLGVDARLGRSVNANARIGGSDRLVDVNVGIGGNGASNTANASNNPNGGGTGVVNGARGNSAATGGRCSGHDPAAAIDVFESTNFSGWQRASSIEIVPLQLCAEDRSQVAQVLSNARTYGQLQAAVQSDALINAALSRSSYGTDRVLGVDRSGSRLTVYVY